MYTHEDIITPIIMNCRVSAPKRIEFRYEIAYKQHDIVLSKEQSVISNITNLSSNEKLLLQHSVLGYKIDLYFPKHKLAIEVQEKRHTDRDEKKKQKKKKENEREEKIKEELGCEFVRINPEKNIMMSILNLIKYAITLTNRMKK